jgi:hypothetical protein
MRAISMKSAVVMAVIVLMPLCMNVQVVMSQPPPVDAPLVREGDFAIQLAEALNIGHPQTETEAENILGAAGIAPRNGWIADYPVTPDIIGELRDSVSYAAQAKTISVDKDKAVQILENLQANVGMRMTPAPAGPPADSITAGTPQETEEGAPAYPDQAVVGDYYTEEGPPVLTYYAPPPDYYYLYEWVPYPFWWGGFWFGGFFILNDFHRHHHDHHFVSNHFNDVNAHRVFRIDPRARFNGRTFAGIGAPQGKKFRSSGVRGAPERIFNRDRSFGPRSDPGMVRPRSEMRPAAPRPSAVNPFHGSRVYSSPAGAGRTFEPRSMSSGSRSPQPRGMSGGNRSVGGGARGGAGQRR